jgi:hypothetical protein
MNDPNRDLDPLAALRDTARTVPEPDWDRMEDRLLGAFAAERDIVRATSERVSVRRWRWASAVAIVAVAITWIPADPPRSVPAAGLPKPREAATQPPALTETAPPPTSPRTAPASRPARRPARAAAADPGPQFTGFVALPNSASLPYFESGHIVRIELAITELPSYGLDLPPDAAPSSVKADLLVGQDGLPRAIRLAVAEQ